MPVFVYAKPRTVIPQEVRVDQTITTGVMVCAGNVPVSAITTENRTDSKGTHKVTFGSSVFSLSTKREHQTSTSNAIKCSEQWQRDKQTDKQTLEAHVMDCIAVREIFGIRGEYLTVMPYTNRMKTLLPGQTHVFYRVSASTPAPAQVVAPPVAPKFVKGSGHRRRDTSWADEVDDDETTCSPAEPVMSEMKQLEREMKELEASNKATEASIASAIEAKKAAEESIAHEKSLAAMRSRRDALVAKQLQLKATQEALQAATQALRSA